MRTLLSLLGLLVSLVALSGCGPAGVSSKVSQASSTAAAESKGGEAIQPAEPGDNPSDPESGDETPPADPDPIDPPPPPDFAAMDVAELLEYAKQTNIAIDVSEDFELTFYPQDIDPGFTAAVIERKDEVIRAIQPDQWTRKNLIGRWELRRPGQVSIINIRGDGVLELTRQHDNIVLRALNAAVNGTIYYQWSYNDGKLYIKNIASERAVLDNLRFLSDAEDTRVEMSDSDHMTLADPNGLDNGEWTRIGL